MNRNEMNECNKQKTISTQYVHHHHPDIPVFFLTCVCDMNLIDWNNNVKNRSTKKKKN